MRSKLSPESLFEASCRDEPMKRARVAEVGVSGQVSRQISTGLLHTLLHLHSQPINVVVFDVPLVTNVKGDLISRGASRLDAFSGYPFRTRLPGRASGETTGTP